MIFGVIFFIVQNDFDIKSYYITSCFVFGIIFLSIAVIIPNKEICFKMVASSMSETKEIEDIERISKELEQMFEGKGNK